MGLVVLASLLVMIWESNDAALCYPEYSDHIEDCPLANQTLFMVLNWCFLVLFFLEFGLRLFADQWGYWRSRWNLLDFSVLVSGVAGEVLGSVSNVSVLRVLRMTRLLRATRLAISVRELYLMLHGIWAAFLAIFWGAIMLGVLLVVFAAWWPLKGAGGVGLGARERRVWDL